MGKKVAILILALFAGTGSVASIFGTEKTGQAPLSDGFVLTGIDGKLSSSDGNDVWFFVSASDVNDGKSRFDANTPLQLLPSSTLERMTADMKQRGGEDYRIWARVTKYKGRNFLFPIYFLLLGEVKDSEPLARPDANSAGTPQTAQVKPRPAANDPNATLAIPKEIIERLSTRPIVRPQPEKQNGQEQKQQRTEQDYILTDRTGLILSRVVRETYYEKDKTHDALRNTQYDFVPDGLGRNVQQACFRLLPCQVLEQAELESVRGGPQMDLIRFKIAGIVSEYKGNKYLLLQRATRVYSHGNFGR